MTSRRDDVGRLDPELDEAHNALGWVKYLAQWDWSGAEQEFQRAIQLNQNNSQAHINYAAVLSAQGKHEQALQEGLVALRLDPSSGDVYYNHTLHLFHARRFDEALSMSKKGMEVDPQHPRWMTLIPRIYLAQGRFTEAIQETEQRLEGDELKRSPVLGYAYARTGRQREAEMVLDAVLHPGGKPSNAAVALIYTGMEDKEHALDWLEKAFEERDTIVTHLKVDPLFDSLRSQPRFQELLRRMHFV